MSLPDGVEVGDRVTAKRLGWNEDVGENFDLEPLADKGYATDELTGELTVVDVPADDEGGTPAITLYLVGGHEADPKTIQPAGGEDEDEDDEGD